MIAAIVRATGLAFVFAAAGGATAANRCVDAKGKRLPLAACAPASALPFATPGTYTTLPERTPSAKGPQGRVYESNPHRDAGTSASTASTSVQPTFPVVVQVGSGNGTAAVGTESSTAPPGTTTLTSGATKTTNTRAGRAVRTP